MRLNSAREGRGRRVVRAARWLSARERVALVVAYIVLGNARSAQAVEGGAEDRSTTHAIAIATGGPSKPDVRCSGTLISPRVVLTVRHCIAPMPPAPFTCDGTFGAPIAPPQAYWVTAGPWSLSSASWKNVASWVLPKNAGVCGNDLALMVLREPFSASEASPARPALSEAEFRDAVRRKVLGIAGFGVSSANASDAGTRRSRFDVPVRCVPGDGAFPCRGELDYVDLREFTTGAGPCKGDSGAGAMRDGDTSSIFGVLSRGALEEGSCREGIFERTDIWGWLIAKTTIDAGRAPAWAIDAFPAVPERGDYCRGAGTCGPDAECVSFDEERSFVCAARCVDDTTCGGGMHCERAVCTKGAAAAASIGEGGCSVTAPRIREGSYAPMSGIFAIELALFSSFVRWCRRRSKPRGGRNFGGRS